MSTTEIAVPGEAQPLAGQITIEQLAKLAPIMDKDRIAAWVNALVEVDVQRRTYAYDLAIATKFAECGQFDDLKNLSPAQGAATALVKIQVGRGWGIVPADSIRHIYFVNGRPSVENEIVAAKLQERGYDWTIEWLETPVENTKYKRCVGCRLWLKRFNQQTQSWEKILDTEGNQVTVGFTEEDARTAGLLTKAGPWKTYARDMYFWRCIARIKKYHAPHVLRGAVAHVEALDVVVPAGAPPDQLPPDLQQPEKPPPAKLRDVILQQEAPELKFPQWPGRAEQPTFPEAKPGEEPDPKK